MARHVSYSFARQNLAEILDEAASATEPVIITRRGHEDVALIPARELRGLEETAHLLRSPRNAIALFQALQEALENPPAPTTIEQLREELGLA
jgi:antitoxin YefM